MATRGLCAAAALVSGLLLAPARSEAAVSCDAGSTVPQVHLDEDFDIGRVKVIAGGTIQVLDGATPVACAGGTPTVTNTAAISIFSNSGFTSPAVDIDGAEAFVPGFAAGDDGGGTPEIEMFVNLHDAPNGTLIVRSPGGSVVFGDSGINYNATPFEVLPDVDITPIGVSKLEARNGTGANGLASTLTAQGGFGTGGPLVNRINLLGNSAADQLFGGQGNDDLFGGDGGDDLKGFAGDDTLNPGFGNDAIDGGAGTDRVTYLTGNVPSLSLDLNVAGPQNTGGGGIESITQVENVDATTGPDVIRGDSGPNTIKTAAGNDIIEGRGGVDTIMSGILSTAFDDTDSIDVRDGGPDTVDCGAATDSVIADAPGVDTLTDCENVSFPAVDDGGGDTGGSGNTGGTGGTGGDGSTARTFGAATLVTLRPGRRVRKRGPLAVRVTNANDFAVTGTLSGRTRRKVPVSSTLRRVRLPARSLAVAAHAAKTIRMRLPRPLRRILMRRGRIALLLTARVTDPVGNVRNVRVGARPRLRR